MLVKSQHIVVVFVALHALIGGRLLAQVRYEPGYFIDNRDQRVECSIYNQDWARSPEKFRYKLSGETESREATINDVKEFSVNQNTYLRIYAQLDTSSQDIKKLSENRGPEWAHRTVFLKRIVDGTGKLYRYRSSKLELFFFAVDDSPIEQLVYKKVLITDKNTAQKTYKQSAEYVENLAFKGQLLARVSCGKSASRADWVRYQESMLKEYFRYYNACRGDKPVEEPRSNNTSLWFNAGWDFATLHMVDDFGLFGQTNEKDPGYHFGVGGEMVLPFNNRKWSLAAELAYQASSGSNSKRYHQSIEVPLGIRHHFFLGENKAVFLNVFAVADFALKYEVVETSPFRVNLLVEDGISGCAAAGGGIKFYRLSVEGRYYFQRTYIHTLTMQYNKASVILAFRVAN